MQTIIEILIKSISNLKKKHEAENMIRKYLEY